MKPLQLDLIEYEKSIRFQHARPLLKWAGGKRQLLPHLIKKVPDKFNKYIEPFFGGGALFFEIKPSVSVVSDSNPELINFYIAVTQDPDKVLSIVAKYPNDESFYYQIRQLNWLDLDLFHAAARTLYLNKTCFNGLYRVNKKGQFNVPFGKYKNPLIADDQAMKDSSKLLRTSQIICSDYRETLNKYAKEGDFVFLDPPYIPISNYSDFKRYTKEVFKEEDHYQLAQEVKILQEKGCYTILTNSNHPLVHELYSSYTRETVQTRRHISCKGSKRAGEDVIVTIAPKKRNVISLPTKPILKQVEKYPPTRFMGSKSKILREIQKVASKHSFETVTDLFSGTGIVSYLFKSMGKKVISNDYLAMSHTFTKAMIENDSVTVSPKEIQLLISENSISDRFVQNTFKGLYFSSTDNCWIDRIRGNIELLSDPYKKAIAMTSLIRTCLKKRPRGIFTYIGDKYDDGRKDLRISFEDHFINEINVINNAIFDNGNSHHSIWGDAMNYSDPIPDLVYMDPPYYSPYSDNEYVRRYHFVEGLARGWQDVQIQENTKTKKFKSYPTPFSSREGAYTAFDVLFNRFKSSIIMLSYSSNSLPTLEELVDLLKKYKHSVEVIEIDYKYSIGNQKKKVNNNKNKVQEYIFIAY